VRTSTSEDPPCPKNLRTRQTTLPPLRLWTSFMDEWYANMAVLHTVRHRFNNYVSNSWRFVVKIDFT